MTRIEEAVEVNVPLHTAYNQWTQFTEFPKFMEGVREVRQIDASHLHWVTECDGKTMEWDTEITQQIPDEVIAWRATSGNSNTGAVRFAPIGEDRTRVTLEMQDEGAPQGADGGEQAQAERIRQDMQRFKAMLESQGRESGAWRGEVAQGQVTSEGGAGSRQQSAGSSGSVQPRDAEPARAMTGTSGSTWLPHLVSMWEEPFMMMRRMSEEMERMVDRFIGRAPTLASPSGAAQWSPAIEIAQEGDRLMICADLPGLSKQDVNVEIRDDKVVIEGQRQETISTGDPSMRRSERRFGRFYRVIGLPQGCDPEGAQATMDNGVLQISLPMASTQSRGRRIDVQQGAQPERAQQLQQPAQPQPQSQPTMQAEAAPEQIQAPTPQPTQPPSTSLH